MAKANSHIDYQGRIGKVSHYKIKDREGIFARYTKGVDKKTILNSPNYQRVRENMATFSQVGRFAGDIKKSLSLDIKSYKNLDVMARLSRIIYSIIKTDTTSARGQKSILLSGNAHLLTGFRLHPNISVESVINEPLETKLDTTAKTISLEIPELRLNHNITSSNESTTGVYFTLSAGFVSDQTWDATTSKLIFTNPLLHRKSYLTRSSVIFLDTTLPSEAQTVELLIPEMPVVRTGVTIVVSLAITFTTISGEEQVDLYSDRTAQVIAVF